MTDPISSPSSREEVNALLNASRAVLRYQSFPDAARAIFDAACRITGARSGYVALLNPDGSENEVLFLESGGLPCSVDPELPMPIRGLRAQAYAGNRTVYENDFMNSEWVSFMPQGHVAMRNVLFAPLVIENKTQGIIGLANKESDFTPRDAQMAGAFGDFAAVALFNSRTMDRLTETISSLKSALAEVRQLKGIIPICAHCKKVKDDDGYWEQVEAYIRDHSDASFSHGLCPDCVAELYPEFSKAKG